jgi:hypothetical protein
VRLAQKFGAGEGADKGSTHRGRDRLGGGGGRCADGAGESEHLVFLEQLLDRFDGFGGLIAVVNALELELAALDAAGLVDLGEGRVETHLHALPQSRGRALEGGCLTEHDLVCRDTVFGEGRNTCRKQGS